MTEIDSTPKYWTSELTDRFMKYCFSYNNCQFDIFEKDTYLTIKSIDDSHEQTRQNINLSYSCYIFDQVLASIPFYLHINTDAGYYKESNIGYMILENGQNIHKEPQAKIRIYINQKLKLESHLDKIIREVNRPAGKGSVVTLQLDSQYCDECDLKNVVGVKLPIERLELEYSTVKYISKEDNG